MTRAWATKAALGSCGLLLGCLKPNPNFSEVDDATATATAAATTSGQAGDTSARTCEDPPDALSDPDSEAEAIALGAIDVDDPVTGATNGVLVDTTTAWWSVLVVEGFSYVPVNVVATAEHEQVGDSVRICAFVECDTATAVALDCQTATPTQSPAGRPGCCARSELALEYTCESFDAWMYLRVDDQQGAACVPFQLNYALREIPIE